MELRWWWAGALVLLAAAVIAVVRLRRRRVPTESDGLLASNTARLRTTPRYQALVRTYTRWLTVQLACLVLALAGAALLLARVATVTVERPEQRNRDVVLCLDVSGSMTDADAKVVRSYRQLVDQMEGERISLVIWDSSPVTVFPLTSDYAFVKTQLEEFAQQLDTNSIDAWSGTMEGSGSSLVGDGLAACVNRFDQTDSDRSRTIVLATDNQVNGEFVFSLPEATDLALRKKIMVYGIYPDRYGGEEADELAAQCRRTKGDLLRLDDDDASTAPIAQAVAKQEQKVFKGQPVRLSHDAPFPAALLLALGSLGVVLAGWRARR